MKHLCGFTWLIAFLFFFSGFAALVYQVTWMRQLSLFFGSDVYSAAITLSAFMGGLSLGSYLAERTVDRLRRPLLWYGVIEIGIGVYAFFFHDLLHSFSPFLKSVYAEHFATSPGLYQMARIGIAAGILLLPTTLMGATLPLVVRRFVTSQSELGRLGGLFYAINTLGALVGVLVAAFVLFPWVGIARTSHIAVAINLLVGVLVVIGTWRVDGRPAADANAGQDQPMAADEIAEGYTEGRAKVALVAIAISGMAALALEVVWTRILTLSFSATVYSFSIMLACFLFGIFQGSRMASRKVDQLKLPLRYFGYLELGIGVSVVLLALVSVVVPGLFGRLLWTLTAVTGGNFGIASVAANVLVSGLFIAVPTILLGATFPVAVRICTPSVSRAGYGTGRVYAANTAGAIFGALLAGYVWVPMVGSRNSLVIIGAIFVLNGLWLIYHAAGGCWSVLRESRPMVGWATASVLSIIVVMLPQQTVMNYNLQASTRPELIYHGEGVVHSIDIVRGANDQVIMMVDGNIEADTSYTQRRHFVLKGHLPLVLHPSPREVAVVGLGLGMTLASTERNPEVQSIQLIELNPEMVRAHEHLQEVNDGVVKKPKVKVRIDDGRNFLAMTDDRFDMITADPIHPRITGVGYLFTREYYEAIRSRLKPGGVVCQWMPMYNISKESFDVAFRTFTSVFEHASFWYVRGHGLFVATTEPFTIDYQAFAGRVKHPVVAADLASIGIRSPEELLAHLLMGPAQIQAYLATSGSNLINTDGNAYLEYHTPFEFLGRTEDIVRALEPHAGVAPGLFTNVTPVQRESVEAAWRIRRAELLSELSKPLE